MASPACDGCGMNSDPGVRDGAEPLELTVSLDGPAGPISGAVTGAGGPVPFHGWLELMDVLEGLRAGEPVPAPTGER